MNKEQLQKKLAEATVAIKGFLAKDSRSEDENKSFETAMNDAESARKELDRLDRAESLVKDAEGSADGNPLGQMTFTGKSAGQDVFMRGQNSAGDFAMNFAYTDDPLFGSDKIVKCAQNDYREAFAEYVKAAGDQGRMSTEARKAMQVGVDADGGLLVPPQMLDIVVRQVAGVTSVANLVQRLPITQGSQAQLLRVQDSGDDKYTGPNRIAWKGERSTNTKQDAVKFEPFAIDVHEGEIEVPISRAFAEDAPAAIEQYLGQTFRESFDFGLESVFIEGDGNGKPWGILTRALAAANAYAPAILNVGDDVDLDEWIKKHYSLPAQYMSGAAYVMQPSAFGELSTLTDPANRYAFGINPNQMANDVPVENFRGHPIYFSDAMPAKAADAHFALHGNFNATYLAIIRMGLSMRMRDIPGQEPAAVFRFRMGGDVKFGRAMKVLKQHD